jgi:hypothetical protein
MENGTEDLETVRLLLTNYGEEQLFLAIEVGIEGSS